MQPWASKHSAVISKDRTRSLSSETLGEQKKLKRPSAFNVGSSYRSGRQSDVLSRQDVTASDLMEHFQQVTQKTASRTFGDNCDDYVLLCKRLNLKLTRQKAQELNIYARGGASEIKRHVSCNNKRDSSKRIVSMTEALINNAKLEDQIDIKNHHMISPELKPLPKVDLNLMAQWINSNWQILKAPRMLFMPRPMNLLQKRQMEQT